jgi:hypothetical protein
MIFKLFYVMLCFAFGKTQTICQPTVQTVCNSSGQCFIINNISSGSNSCDINILETTTKTTTQSSTSTTPTNAILCPTGFNFCQNNGICMILNGRDVVCSCLSGFSGNKITYLI